MSWEPIRSLDEITGTDHAAKNKMRERNIGVTEVRYAIEEGSVTEGKTDTTLKYRLDMPGVDLLVVVDIPKKQIVTVYYDDDQGATGGRL